MRQLNPYNLFFFTKNKPALKDLISGYTDIHSHLLPGIDDGSKNFETTLMLVQSLQKIGFEQFITTPHVIKNIWDNSKTGIESLAVSTAQKLGEHKSDVPFKAAAEYMMDDSFSKLMESEKLLTLKDNYILVEMSYINPPMQLYDIIFDIKIAGYQPVLAHPERYLFYHNNFEEYKKIKKAGCLFQLNLLSAVGYYGTNVGKTAEKLLKNGMIDFTGSDLHHENHLRSFEKKLLFSDTSNLKEAIKNNDFFRS